MTRHIAEFRDFMAKLGGEMIVKPLDGAGRGHLPRRDGDRNLNRRSSSRRPYFGTRRAMAQRYLPAVRQGDKRILLLEGEPLGALLRVPAESEAAREPARRRAGGSERAR